MSEINALVIDHGALNRLGSAILDDKWFSRFDWPSGSLGIRRVQIGSSVYLFSARADEYSRMIVIKTGRGGVFDVPSPSPILDRIIHVALAAFEKTVSVPVGWKPYNYDSRYSIYAFPAAMARDERLYFERWPNDTQWIYAYGTDRSKDFDEVQLDMRTFTRAYEGVVDALLAEAAEGAGANGGAFGIVLAPLTGSFVVGSATLDEWYSTKLTSEQRAFVDKGYDEPVRLKGAAGTGKTLSMAIKCLKDALTAEARQEKKKFAFLTHSAAVAHETIPGMFDCLDPTGHWRELTHAHIWVGSIYELAEDLLRYHQKGLSPLSTDGMEGREFQALEVVSAIKRLLASTKFMLKEFPHLTEAFRRGMQEASETSPFVQELMNEIACVIDAENIRLGNAAAERYLKVARERWQMSLDNAPDREAVLLIHDEYRKELERSDVLSMDQMVADFNRYLETHEWDRLKGREGFDAVFVDELHYFNRAERMIFHNLFNDAASSGGKMPLFMSYDLKQSPADSFLGGGGGESAATFFQRIRAGESQLVELTKVFRSTPQITEFLSDLDAAFPALDLEGEWGHYAGKSEVESGEVPILREYTKNTILLDDVFERAAQDAMRVGGRNVAILCLNEELYARYLNAGRIANKYVELSGRDQVHQLKYAGRRPVFSMPEYVAGLQFKVVYLIHVDRAEISHEMDSIGQRRRFISKCYLGASRASEVLQIAVSRERGGASDILDLTLERGSLATYA